MRRVTLAALALLAAVSITPLPEPVGNAAAADVSAETRVVVLTTDFVLDGKLRALADAAGEQGVSLAWYRPGDDETSVADALSGASLLVLDTPRGNDMAAVQQAFGETVRASGVPRLSVVGGQGRGEGLEPEHAAALGIYYTNGTRANFDGFFRYWAVEVVGIASGPVPEPVVFPAEGIYHPELAELMVAEPERYAQWLAERAGRQTSAAAAPPVPARVGVIMSQGLFTADQMALVDDMIRRIEAGGAEPWVFHFDGDETGAMSRMVTVDGEPAVDVLINLTHLRGVTERPRELAELDVPLLQGFTYRDGTPQQWRDDTAGIPMRAVPAFLAIPEQMGAQDPVVIAAVEHGEPVVLDAQMDLLVNRALATARLRAQPADERRVALMYWSYPPGERGVSASNLNVPRSLERVTAAMAEAGYRVQPDDAATLETVLPSLLDPWQGRRGLADWAAESPHHIELPMAAYRDWFDGLPGPVRARVIDRWGEPEDDAMVLTGDDGGRFVIPAYRRGDLLMLPQPSRSPGGSSLASYHDGDLPPSHGYLAAYLVVRDVFGADALVHFGTHGSQEFLAGKERGLSAHDDAWLVLGDLPVIYPYITDNVGEALQAKRRGRAVTVSHMTPPFAPAGLHGELMEVHDLIHDWEMLDEGPVRERVERAIVAKVGEGTLYRDLGWEHDEIGHDFAAFQHDLHLYLHELAVDAQPLGLHTFGRAPEPGHRVSTVMQMLGERLYDALALDEPDELFVDDHTRLADSEPYRFVARFLIDGEDPDAPADATLRELARQALVWDRAMTGADEIGHLLAALAGRYIPTSYGGDPIRNPDILPTGRNLYGFDPARLPTERAWEVGRELADELLQTHVDRHGDYPRSLAVSLWSSEAMRHQGVMEAQLLHLLGLQPRWDRGGRLEALDLVPAEELGRPRVDVVASVTGVYRDQFPQFIDHLSEALLRVAQLDEADNPVAAHSRALAARLTGNGTDAATAARLAAIRVFSGDSGRYGTGVPEGVFDTEGWEEDGELAAAYLSRMQYGYGVGEGLWAVRLDDVNLYAEHLGRVEGAVLGRSSNLHGLLSTDHPFEYLGGIALAVRHLSGRTPDLYVSNLRNPSGGRNVSAERFIAGELRSRYQHPGWIEAMREEGYAGSLELLNVVNNFFGWQVMDPSVVRDDQWGAFHDVYVRDSLGLDLEQWFADVNPDALQRIVERMLEAAWRGYWDAGEDALRDLVERHVELTDGTGIGGRLGEHIDGLARGFGLQAPADALTETVAGQRLTPVSAEAGASAQDLAPRLVLLGLLVLMLIGALRQARLPRVATSVRFTSRSTA